MGLFESKAMKLAISLFFVVVCAFSREVAAQDRSVIPLPEPAFEGKIGETYKNSEGAWPKLPAPPAGAPNVVVILLDDVGFGQTGTFGGPIPMATVRWAIGRLTSTASPERASCSRTITPSRPVLLDALHSSLGSIPSAAA